MMTWWLWLALFFLVGGPLLVKYLLWAVLALESAIARLRAWLKWRRERVTGPHPAPKVWAESDPDYRPPKTFIALDGYQDKCLRKKAKSRKRLRTGGRRGRASR
jgi:hypothetical protein